MRSLVTERVLGLIWRPTTDELTFNLDLARLPAGLLNNSHPTKREALKVVMSLYDPLGYAAPVTVRAKAILQEAWRRGLSWDQRFPDDLATVWADWLKKLLALKHVTIPRCYPGFTHAVNTQLHVFTDASQEAYATALYWRTTLITGEINVSLIMAKARVCPLKLHSIPRLEILGAVMGARMSQVVKEEHEKQPDSTTFWTDSKTVLQWVRNGSRSYKLFVAHRIAAIQEHSKVNEWRYVPTKLNVADDATRDTPRDFASSHRWYTGPEFLTLPEGEWPQYLPDDSEETTTGEERAYTASTARKININEAIPDASRFSKWERYLRTTARVLQFIELCKKKDAVNYKRTKANTKADPDWRKNPQKKIKVNKKKSSTPSLDLFEPLTTSLLRRATTLIWRSVQHNAFKEDITAIQNNELRNGKLKNLAVTITEDLVTLVSRIDAAVNTEVEKNPIVLDGRQTATRLYIDFIHRRLHHARVETVINEIRQQYWILHLRSVTRQVVHACRLCAKRRALPPNPPTGNHPHTRLAHHKRAYTYTGWDFFGPYTVTVGRATQKRYVALFTCLTTRGVHLEVASSLSTDSAIATLRKFIARRGCPTEIWSDNGTNLTGADKELRRALETGLNTAATQRGITWRFIPPGSPFMGGAWERMVSSVKKALSTVLNERHPNDETLSTLLAEVEFSVNSRPLTHVVIDADEPTAITPNHFTIGPDASNPSPGTFNERDTVGRATWRTAQRLADMFWARWLREYLPQLQNRREPTHKGPIIAIDDVVLVVDDTLPRNTWPMGIVTALYPGEDGIIRVVDIRTKGGTLRRPTKKLVILPTREENSASAPSPSNTTPGQQRASARNQCAPLPGPPGPPGATSAPMPGPQPGLQRVPSPSNTTPGQQRASARNQCAPLPGPPGPPGATSAPMPGPQPGPQRVPSPSNTMPGQQHAPARYQCAPLLGPPGPPSAVSAPMPGPQPGPQRAPSTSNTTPDQQRAPAQSPRPYQALNTPFPSDENDTRHSSSGTYI